MSGKSYSEEKLASQQGNKVESVVAAGPRSPPRCGRQARPGTATLPLHSTLMPPATCTPAALLQGRGVCVLLGKPPAAAASGCPQPLCHPQPHPAAGRCAATSGPGAWGCPRLVSAVPHALPPVLTNCGCTAVVLPTYCRGQGVPPPGAVPPRLQLRLRQGAAPPARRTGAHVGVQAALLQLVLQLAAESSHCTTGSASAAALAPSQRPLCLLTHSIVPLPPLPPILSGWYCRARAASTWRAPGRGMASTRMGSSLRWMQ